MNKSKLIESFPYEKIDEILKSIDIYDDIINKRDIVYVPQTGPTPPAGWNQPLRSLSKFNRLLYKYVCDNYKHSNIENFIYDGEKYGYCDLPHSEEFYNKTFESVNCVSFVSFYSSVYINDYLCNDVKNEMIYLTYSVLKKWSDLNDDCQLLNSFYGTFSHNLDGKPYEEINRIISNLDINKLLYVDTDQFYTLDNNLSFLNNEPYKYTVRNIPYIKFLNKKKYMMYDVDFKYKGLYTTKSPTSQKYVTIIDDFKNEVIIKQRDKKLEYLLYGDSKY